MTAEGKHRALVCATITGSQSVSPTEQMGSDLPDAMEHSLNHSWKEEITVLFCSKCPTLLFCLFHALSLGVGDIFRRMGLGLPQPYSISPWFGALFF